MASRTTALNELEYSELVTRLRALADEIGAEPEIPDMIEVMGEARTLHRFVAGHDAQLGVNLMSNGAPWAMSTLIGALEKQGFDVRPGRPLRDAGRRRRHAVHAVDQRHAGRRHHLAPDAAARRAMRGAGARRLRRDGRLRQARWWRASTRTIVDDCDQPLTDEALAEINGQVLEFYQEMEAADIPAGSTRAHAPVQLRAAYRDDRRKQRHLARMAWLTE